jgi:hypothetical protein
MAETERLRLRPWAAELNDGGTLIGYLGLSIPHWLAEVLPAVEVGWRLHPDHWGRGRSPGTCGAPGRPGRRPAYFLITIVDVVVAPAGGATVVVVVVPPPAGTWGPLKMPRSANG